VEKRQRNRLIIGIVVLAGFIWLGLGAFRDSLNPYVTFAEARAATDRTVQVTGDLPAGRRSWYGADETRAFHFLMVSPAGDDTLEVAFEGVKPSTFDDASSVVAIGTWDGNRFRASQVLTKCPSKYEGKDPTLHRIGEGDDIPPGGPR
jgi:cytochrome c-type biogenesis protein CcmE